MSSLFDLEKNNKAHGCHVSNTSADTNIKFDGRHMTEHADQFTTRSLGNAKSKSNKVIMSDSASIAYCDKPMAIIDPKADKTFKQYGNGNGRLLGENLPQTCNHSHKEEKMSRKEACDAFLLKVQKSQKASASIAQIVPKITPESKDIARLLCRGTLCY